METFSGNTILEECKKRLITKKQELLNRLKNARRDYTYTEKSGDEADQSVAHIAEHTFLVSQERIRSHLLEVEFALARIEKGSFGICEETEEPIETERLLAVPWTRLSIEGAEIREAFSRKFAK